MLIELLVALGFFDGAVQPDPIPDPPSAGGYRIRRFSRSNT